MSTSSITARWGLRGTAHLLVRPDGHVAYRRDDKNLAGVAVLLVRWLSG